jgi:hypothetical protein
MLGHPRLISLSCAFFLLLMLGRPAQAQSSDPAALAEAQRLFDQAMADMKKDNYSAACPNLEKVVRLVPAGIGAKEELAKCYEKQGRLASAWAQFVEVEGQARQQGQTERAREAGDRAAALKSRLPTLAVDVAAPARAIPGLTVTRDGVPVSSEQWGSALPVDAGKHEIVASAPGRKSFNRTVEVTGERVNVRIEIPALTRPEAKLAPAAATTQPSSRTWQSPVGWAVMGVGVAGVGAGLVFGALAIARNDASKADGQCSPDNKCHLPGFILRNEARTFGDASTVAFIAGGVLLTGGVALLLTAPRPRPKLAKEGAHLASRDGEIFNPTQVQLRMGATGISLQGAW